MFSLITQNRQYFHQRPDGDGSINSGQTAQCPYAWSINSAAVRPAPHHTARFHCPFDEIAEKLTRAAQPSLVGRAKTSPRSRRIGTRAMPACLP